MAENMKESTLKIRSRVKAYSIGQMGGNMKVIGLMVNSMEEELLLLLITRKEMGNGIMVKELDGLMNEIIKCIYMKILIVL